ncbi:MAG TPA: hypothetical protein VMF50_10995 [Candidatus Binataceae bacterium]|nr:hypothetical protein [Candidatus Binataceae bacterium]
MKNRQILDKWREFYAAALFDLPAAVAQGLVLDADHPRRDKCLDTTVWRAYEAWIWLVNETANRFYSTVEPPSSHRGHLRLAFSAPANGRDEVPGNQPNDWSEAR